MANFQSCCFLSLMVADLNSDGFPNHQQLFFLMGGRVFIKKKIIINRRTQKEKESLRPKDIQNIVQTKGAKQLATLTSSNPR